MTQRPDVYADFMRDQVFDSLEQLDELAAARGISMAGLSLSWLLANPDVSAIVVGPGQPDQLEPVREALANPLDPEARESVAGLFR
jgi:aryl-alcohol dehydrogenase-like predicted oxidoreductase